VRDRRNSGILTNCRGRSVIPLALHFPSMWGGFHVLYDTQTENAAAKAVFDSLTPDGSRSASVSCSQLPCNPPPVWIDRSCRLAQISRILVFERGLRRHHILLHSCSPWNSHDCGRKSLDNRHRFLNLASWSSHVGYVAVVGK